MYAVMRLQLAAELAVLKGEHIGVDEWVQMEHLSVTSLALPRPDPAMVGNGSSGSGSDSVAQAASKLAAVCPCCVLPHPCPMPVARSGCRRRLLRPALTRSTLGPLRLAIAATKAGAAVTRLAPRTSCFCSGSRRRGKQRRWKKTSPRMYFVLWVCVVLCESRV